MDPDPDAAASERTGTARGRGGRGKRADRGQVASPPSDSPNDASAKEDSPVTRAQALIDARRMLQPVDAATSPVPLPLRKRVSHPGGTASSEPGSLASSFDTSDARLRAAEQAAEHWAMIAAQYAQERAALEQRSVELVRDRLSAEEQLTRLAQNLTSAQEEISSAVEARALAEATILELLDEMTDMAREHREEMADYMMEESSRRNRPRPSA